MKQKIIGLVSGAALFGGFVAAGILSAGEPTVLQCIPSGSYWIHCLRCRCLSSMISALNGPQNGRVTDSTR